MSFKKKIYIALNLNYIVQCSTGATAVSSDVIYWPDGIFSKLVSYKNKKVPGRIIFERAINYLKCVGTERCLIVGSPSERNIEFLNNQGLLYNYYDPGFIENIDDITITDLDLSPYSFIIIAISTPKQEWLAEKLYSLKRIPILCIGGALNMASGEESPVPKQLESIEGIWRTLFGGRRIMIRNFNILWLFCINFLSVIETIKLMRKICSMQK